MRSLRLTETPTRTSLLPETTETCVRLSFLSRPKIDELLKQERLEDPDDDFFEEMAEQEAWRQQQEAHDVDQEPSSALRVAAETVLKQVLNHQCEDVAKAQAVPERKALLAMRCKGCNKAISTAPPELSDSQRWSTTRDGIMYCLTCQSPRHAFCAGKQDGDGNFINHLELEDACEKCQNEVRTKFWA